MQFAIRHFMPGRVRLSIPALTRDRTVAEETLAWLFNALNSNAAE